MKWAIVGLTVLGFAAAACAALLVSALRAGSILPMRGQQADGDIQVLYAKQPLEAMTVIEGDMVAAKTMPRSQAPRDAISDPVQVVGRVLTVPLVAEQAFVTSHFASESSASLAAAVGKGKRAVGISVTDYAGLEGLLYPGSVVDVMMTLKSETPGFTGSRVAARGALTTTLLQRVQVLAIERQTVVSAAPDKVGSDVESSMNNMRPKNTRRITLLVDTKQAKTLQLAMEQGTLSLALRNPLDTGDADRDQVSLRSILGLKDPVEEPKDSKPGMLERMVAMAAQAAANARNRAAAPKRSADPFAETTTADAKPPRWETTVIRGDKAQVYTFDMEKPGEGPVKADAEAQPASDEKAPAEGDGPIRPSEPSSEPASQQAASAEQAGETPNAVTQ